MSKPRLVNAEEVRQFFDYEVAQGATDLFDTFDSAIENATTVDAAPVVHGRWVRKEHYGLRPDAMICSICKRPYELRLTRYCPNCGAKMDGGISDA